MDRKYVKLADDPTFYLVEDGCLVRPMASMAEVYQVGLLPVEMVSELPPAAPQKECKRRQLVAPLPADDAAEVA